MNKRQELEDKLLDYLRNDNTSHTLDEIVQLTESLSVEDKILSANALVTTEETSKILLEAYKASNLDDTLLEQHISLLQDVQEFISSKSIFSAEHINYVSEALDHLRVISDLHNSQPYIYTKTMESLQNELDVMDKRIVLEGSQIEWDEDIALETALAKTQAEFNLAFTRFFLGPEETECTFENASELVRLSNRYDSLLIEKYDALEEASNGKPAHEPEVKVGGKPVDFKSSQSGAKRAAVKMDEKSRKAANSIRKKGSEAKRVGTIAAKAGGRFTSLVTNTVGKLNQMNKEQRMEAILSGGMRQRVSNLLRNAVVVGTAAAVNPVLGLITLMTTAALRKRSDERLVREVLSDYEGELKVVREKIRDAESAGDRKKKYELMRIETHIEQNIERIKAPAGRRNKPKLRKG